MESKKQGRGLTFDLKGTYNTCTFRRTQRGLDPKLVQDTAMTLPPSSPNTVGAACSPLGLEGRRFLPLFRRMCHAPFGSTERQASGKTLPSPDRPFLFSRSRTYVDQPCQQHPSPLRRSPFSMNRATVSGADSSLGHGAGCRGWPHGGQGGGSLQRGVPPGLQGQRARLDGRGGPQRCVGRRPT